MEVSVYSNDGIIPFFPGGAKECPCFHTGSLHVRCRNIRLSMQETRQPDLFVLLSVREAGQRVNRKENFLKR